MLHTPSIIIFIIPNAKSDDYLMLICDGLRDLVPFVQF